MRNLFLSHIFLRDLSYSAGLLGWVYLFESGTPIMVLCVALCLFRLFESFICMPVAYKLFHTIPTKRLLFFALVLKIGFLLSFPLAAEHSLYLLLTILFLSTYDVLYWPTRDNLERLIAKGTLPSRIGLTRGVSVVAHAIGFTIGGLTISTTDPSTFLWAGAGIALSGIPLLLMRMPRGISREAPAPFFTTITEHRKTAAFMRSHAVLLISFAAITKEVTDYILPLALALIALELSEIGYLMSLFVILQFAADVIAGYVDGRRRKKIFALTGFASLILFIGFMFLPYTSLSYFFVMFALSSGPFFTVVDVYVQQYVSRHLPDVSGGFFIEFVDDTARSLPFFPLFAFPAILTAPHLVLFLLAAGAMTTTGTILIGLGKIRD